MKILVPIKRVLDPDQPKRVAEGGRTLEDSDAMHLINPFDAIALEEAVRIRETRAGDIEIVAVSIAPGDSETELRAALAIGANRATLVRTGEEPDPWNVSSILQAVVQRESPQLVLMGKQAVDDDSNQTGQFLAARLGWPQATFASKIEPLDDALRVSRETDLGVETLTVPLPAVVTCDLRLNEPRYASVPAILKARRKPLDVLAPADLGIELARKIEVLALENVHAARQCCFVESVDELIIKLREEAKVLA